MMEGFICYSSFILRSWYTADRGVLGILGGEFNFKFNVKNLEKDLTSCQSWNSDLVERLKEIGIYY